MTADKKHFCAAVAPRVDSDLTGHVADWIHDEFPFPLLEDGDENPVVTESLEEISRICRDRNVAAEIHRYYGRTKYLYEIAMYGHHKVGVDIVAKVS